MRNCQGLKKMETQYLVAMWDPGLMSGTKKKNNNGKSDKSPNKDYTLVDRIESMFSGFEP